MNPSAIHTLAFSAVTVVIIVVPLVLAVFFFSYIQTRYRRVGPNEVLIVTGAGETQYLTSGGTLIWPVIQSAQSLSLRPYECRADVTDALAKNRDRADLTVACTVAVDTDEAMLKKAAQRLIDLEEAQITETVEQIVRGQVGNVVAAHDIEAIDAEPAVFSQQCKQAVADDIAALGLEIQSFNVSEITTRTASEARASVELTERG